MAGLYYVPSIQCITSDASIAAYDINLGLLEYKSPKATYFEMDLTEDYSSDYRDFDLAFFDDHVSHFDRLQFCVQNRIRFVVLDDDVSIYQVHADGWPPIPSVAMVFDYQNIPKQFSWIINEKGAEANIESIDVAETVDTYNRIPFPDLSECTGYKDTSSTSLVVKRHP